MKSMREAYGAALAELGATDKNVAVLDADLSSSTKTSVFAKRFPKRFFEVGIAEQNLLGTAAGLAAAGKIPFASTFAVFASGRAWEQARNAIAYGDLNVKIVATHAGLSVGPDGATHQALEDVALMRAIPRFRVCVPCDANETRAMVYAFAAVRGPCYARLPRIESPEILGEDCGFAFGKWPLLREGGDACILANGLMVAEALEAARLLAKRGTSVRVLDASTVKPLDERALLRAAGTGAVVTAEEHSIIGGLGGAVCEFLSERKPCAVERVGTRDRFGESGEPRELFEKYGLTAAAIAKAVRSAMKRA